MSWSDWAAGTLAGVGAPNDAVNIDTLWAWSRAESGVDVMRWNNPLNTTLAMFSTGNVDANRVGVKIYPTGEVGIRATVLTLLNGRYPVIVDHLRRSVPRQQWGDACANLGVWGTGCGWIGQDYGAAPGVVTEGGTPDLTSDEHYVLVDIQNKLVNTVLPLVDDIHGSFGTAPGQTIAQLLAGLKDSIDQLSGKIDAAFVRPSASPGP